jgi:hypothetical protein
LHPTPRRAGSNGRGALHDRNGHLSVVPVDSAWLDELDAPDLQLEEVARRENTGSGYDPYDTIPNVRQANSMQRHAELRQLSDWIRQQREADNGGQPAGDGAAQRGLAALRRLWPGRRR